MTQNRINAMINRKVADIKILKTLTDNKTETVSSTS